MPDSSGVRKAQPTSMAGTGAAAGNGAEPFAHVAGRGSVNYLIRNTQQHLVQLSFQADIKANILISVCALLLTAGAAMVDEARLRPSMVLLMTGSTITLALSVFAVLPGGRADKRQGRGPGETPDPLFFEDAARDSLSRYFRRMGQACADDSHLYELQFRNLHRFSRYLAEQKYRAIRRAYLTFLVSMLAAAVAYPVNALLS